MKIKDKYKLTIVGFNNSTIALGERTDLYILANIAIKSGDKLIINLFETLPSLEQINKEKEKLFLKENLEK